MRKIAGKHAEVTLWGTGKRCTGHREHRERGKQIARRAYSRAVRQAARRECKGYALGNE